MSTGIGAIPYFNAAVSNTPVGVRSNSCRLYSIHAINPGLTDCYIQLFALPAASVTAGTTVPSQSWIIPGGTGAANVGAFALDFSMPIQFNVALTILVSTTPTGSTAPGAACVVNLGLA